MSITYIIEGQPVPLQRPRFSRGHVFDSQKDIKYAIGLLLRSQHSNRPMYEDAIHLDIVFYMTIPKKSKVTGWHIKRADLDNLVKLICDVSIGILYEDDSCIAKITACKVYDSIPRTEFTLTQLPERTLPQL